MFDFVWVSLAQSAALLTSVYWVCLIVGGGLLIISALGGAQGHAEASGEFHVDTDVHADVGHADVDSPDAAHGDFGHSHTGHHHAGSPATWFSIRFVVFFVAVFGLVGVVFTHLTKVPTGAVLGSAAVSGLVVGQGVHQLLRKLQRSSGDSTPQPEDYVNKLGRVTIRIEPPQKGEVAVPIGQGERFVPAVSRRADRKFKVSEQVYIVAYGGGIAEVVSREEFEFLKGT